MPTNRMPIARSPTSRITATAASLYRSARTLCDDVTVEEWEEDGGRRREYLDTDFALHVELGRQPWEESILGTLGADTPPTWVRKDKLQDWLSAHAIRVALDQATAAK